LLPAPELAHVGVERIVAFFAVEVQAYFLDFALSTKYPMACPTNHKTARIPKLTFMS